MAGKQITKVQLQVELDSVNAALILVSRSNDRLRDSLEFAQETEDRLRAARNEWRIKGRKADEIKERVDVIAVQAALAAGDFVLEVLGR